MELSQLYHEKINLTLNFSTTTPPFQSNVSIYNSKLDRIVTKFIAVFVKVILC